MDAKSHVVKKRHTSETHPARVGVAWQASWMGYGWAWMGRSVGRPASGVRPAAMVSDVRDIVELGVSAVLASCSARGAPTHTAVGSLRLRVSASTELGHSVRAADLDQHGHTTGWAACPASVQAQPGHGLTHAAVREKRLLIGLGGLENRTGGRCSGEGGEGAHKPVCLKILQKFCRKIWQRAMAEASANQVRRADLRLDQSSAHSSWSFACAVALPVTGLEAADDGQARDRRRTFKWCHLPPRRSSARPSRGSTRQPAFQMNADIAITTEGACPALAFLDKKVQGMDSMWCTRCLSL